RLLTLDTDGVHVSSETDLERGLAVPEEVVGGTEPRTEVFEVRHVRLRREVTSGRKRNRIVVLRWTASDDLVESESQRQWEATDGPLVAGKETPGLEERLRRIWRRVLGQLNWHSVSKRDGNVRVGEIDRISCRPTELHARLEGMRAGDKRDPRR